MLLMLSFLLFFIFLEIFYPIKLTPTKDLSRVVLDRSGKVVYATLNSKDKWRFSVDLKKIDLNYKRVLLNFEDKRFYKHWGVDYLALLRASWQLIKYGHITSGGSTITMQLARLLEPKSRTISSKIIEIFRAYQLELHYSKDEILSAYLTLAPYGGNVEGIVAASMRYFGKAPNALTLSQSAILVSIPQSPELNRPDRYKSATKEARDKVLKRAYEAKIIDKSSYNFAKNSKIEAKVYKFPRFSPHLSQELLKNSKALEIESRLNLPLQNRLEIWAKNVGTNLPKGATLGVIVLKNSSGEVLSYIGSYDMFNKDILGYIDINRAIRSPGSILKPLIYGMALENGIVDVNTIIKDNQSQFGEYRPHNFSKKYHDEVTVAYALQNSLNIPAIKVLQKVGVDNFLDRLKNGCGKVILPKKQANLTVALGGLGIKAVQIAQIYSILANGGTGYTLHYLKGQKGKKIKLLNSDADAKVVDILREAVAPRGFTNLSGFLAYKTGTSYGYRDFWSAVFSKEITVVVLVAKANNSSIIKSSARDIALPLAFEVMSFVKSYIPHNSWSRDSKINTKRVPSNTLKYLYKPKEEVENFKFLYPKEGAKFQSASCEDVTVEFKLKGGKSPYIWYIDGKEKKFNKSSIRYSFKEGAHTISAIDKSAKQVVVDIWVNSPNCN